MVQHPIQNKAIGVVAFKIGVVVFLIEEAVVFVCKQFNDSQ